MTLKNCVKYNFDTNILVHWKGKRKSILGHICVTSFTDGLSLFSVLGVIWFLLLNLGQVLYNYISMFRPFSHDFCRHRRKEWLNFVAKNRNRFVFNFFSQSEAKRGLAINWNFNLTERVLLTLWIDFWNRPALKD